MSVISKWMVLSAALAGCAAPALAQDFPQRSMRVVVTSAAGSGIDLAARLVSQHLADAWGQPVIVDNKVGASGQIGGTLVARAAPDGHTLLVVSPVFVISESLYPKLPYRFLTDFAPVVRIGTTPYVMAVTPRIPAKSLAEFVTYAKGNPKQIHYGSNGSGTIMHLAGELFRSATGADLVHVPYKESTMVLTDMIGGRLEMMFNSVTLLAPNVKAGKLRALAVAGAKPSALLPDIPTFIDSGFKGFRVESWYGIVAPARTPPAVIAKLQKEISAAANAGTMRDRLVSMGTDPLDESTAQFTASLKDETERYAQVIKAAGIKAE
jgi:tripartite-type tricarboxylate transporter receptor subunit TctC